MINKKLKNNATRKSDTEMRVLARQLAYKLPKNLEEIPLHHSRYPHGND